MERFEKRSEPLRLPDELLDDYEGVHLDRVIVQQSMIICDQESVALPNQ